MRYLDVELRATIYYRCDFVLKAIEACELKAQMNGDVDVVEIDSFLAVALRRPYQAFAEVNLAARLVV